MAQFHEEAAAESAKTVAPSSSSPRHAGTRRTVVLFRDFQEDRRVSMEIYADELAGALAAHCGDLLRIAQYRPRIPSMVSALPVSEHQRMRIARYASYPLQVRNCQGDINHVIEHGYGHLLYGLVPERTIVTVHDLIPLLLWKGEIRGIAEGRRPWLSEISLRALKRAAHLIAISESTKRDLIRHIGCDPSRVSVVYWGVHQRFRPYDQPARLRFRSELGMPGPDAHVVLITDSGFYKNSETSLRVAAHLRGRCPRPIVLARRGAPSAAWDSAVRQAGMEDRVIAVPHLPTERMPELYNAVDCLLFPSWYEGFGLPPLEAMACGIPVVTSNGASLQEAVGEAAFTAAPDDVGSLAEGIRILLEDSEKRLEQIEKGLRQAAKFSWAQAAHVTAQIYQNLFD